MKYPVYANSEISSIENPIVDAPSISGEVNSHIRIRRLNNFYDKDRDRFFRMLYVKEGVKAVQVDSEKFTSLSNMIVFVSPGQKLKIDLAANPVGWVFQFSKAFYNLIRYEDYENWSRDFFNSDESFRKLLLSPDIGERIHLIAGMVDELTGSLIPGRANGIKALLKAILVYCNCKSNLDLNDFENLHEITIISRFKELVNEHFTSLHMVSDYARILNITPKYLNQVAKHILGITAKQVIQEQIITSAKQELKFSNCSIKDIAQKLGFTDPYHFSSFFKELVGTSPLGFRDR